MISDIYDNRNATYDIQDHIWNEAALEQAEKSTSGEKRASTTEPELGSCDNTPEDHLSGDLSMSMACNTIRSTSHTHLSGPASCQHRSRVSSSVHTDLLAHELRRKLSQEKADAEDCRN